MVRHVKLVKEFGQAVEAVLVLATNAPREDEEPKESSIDSKLDELAQLLDFGLRWD
eukprot:SAG31_NODE_2476_length_5639_cov_8.703069_3_plen_56_part_00